MLWGELFCACHSYSKAITCIKKKQKSEYRVFKFSHYTISHVALVSLCMVYPDALSILLVFPRIAITYNSLYIYYALFIVDFIVQRQLWTILCGSLLLRSQASEQWLSRLVFVIMTTCIMQWHKVGHHILTYWTDFYEWGCSSIDYSVFDHLLVLLI